MANEMHLPGGLKLPLKETIDYAKNVAFCITLQTIAMTIAAPHNGADSHWWWKVFAGLIILPTGVLSAAVAQQYHENWPGLSPTRRWLFTGATILAIFIAGMATKIRLAEDW